MTCHGQVWLDEYRDLCPAELSVGLRQLTMTWSASTSYREGTLTFSSDAFPDLAVLKHLTQLKLHQANKLVYAIATLPTPSQPLPALQHLVLKELKVMGSC